jgi:hypothetical protein
MQEKENIIRILNETKDAINKQDSVKLKELSNQTIHTVSVSQDPDNIAIAVIVYSLNKIVERNYLKKNKLIISIIDDLIINLKENNEKRIKKNLDLLRKNLVNITGSLKKYILEVFKKASINKASKIYEHGISMERTASLLGITMYDLASYAGQKETLNISSKQNYNVKSRIKLVMDIFK